MNEFIEALETSDNDKIRDALANIKNINSMIGGKTPLGLAIGYRSSIDLIKHIIDIGADIEKGAKNGVTPLMLACEYGHWDAFLLLIELGANINAVDKAGISCLYYSIGVGECFVEYLIKCGADVKYVPIHGFTLLDKVYNSKDHGASVVLMKAGVNPELSLVSKTKKYKEVTQWLTEIAPIVHAVENNDKDEIERLLKQGVSPNTISIMGDSKESLLYIASIRGFYEIVKLILQHGGDVEIKSYGKWTALLIASERGFYEIVELLIENGADILYENSPKWHALTRASISGHYDIVELLLKTAAEKNVVYDVSEAKEWALKKGFTEINQRLVDYETYL